MWENGLKSRQFYYYIIIIIIIIIMNNGVHFNENTAWQDKSHLCLSVEEVETCVLINLKTHASEGDPN